MKFERKVDKIMVLGIDGMDPELTKYHLDKGLMPNLQKFLERGSAREDLHMLGSHPTITPPMWTTLACGCHPYVHGVTDFWRQDPVKLDTYGYGLESTNCAAEQIWNVFAEAGWNTLVWHWPGSSWPPTSDSPNLTVVDGTQPEGVNMGTGQVQYEFIAVCSEETEQTTFKVAAGETSHMCVITDLEEKESGYDTKEYTHFVATSHELRMIFPKRSENHQTSPATGGMSTVSMDISLGAIKPATGWANAPADAKESTILFSRGLVRRPVLILKNEQGVYDRVALYKNKKSEEPIRVLTNGVFEQDIIDEAIKGEKKYEISRNMRILEMKEDGSYFRVWCSAETDINDCKVWSPQSLFGEIKENVGLPQPISNLGSADDQLIRECMHENWRRYMKWQADCLHYMIEKKGVEAIFTHIHNDDAEKHMYLHFAREGGDSLAKLPVENYVGYLEDVSKQNDEYIGRFLHLLDEGWTILLVSDHGLTCNKTDEMSSMVGAGIDTGMFVDWGFTTLKQDANGALEVDWEKTKAIKTRMNEVYINLKGKYPTGIVDPEDKWELEEEIITKLYSLTSPKTGHRMVSVALRNKDAVHLGLGGPECGDIIVWTTDGYNNEHGCGLSTTLGAAHTSQSPIFAAAGKGIKVNYRTTRVIREIDVAPTVVALAGVRMPRDVEGAPVYQILED